MSSASASAQYSDASFMKHLMARYEYQKVLLLADEISQYNPDFASDTLLYYRGLSKYYLEKLNESSNILSKIRPESSLYQPAQLFHLWNQAYLGNTKVTTNGLYYLNGRNPTENDLIAYEQLGAALLSRNNNNYREIRPLVKGLHYAWESSLSKMDHHAATLEQFKPKSMALAGIGSAVIPGLGKIYAGETGAGISSFLLVGAMGAMTIENGMKSGWTSWNTLLFGGLFLILHAGNIYGSMMSVKNYRYRFYEDFDQRILWDMHMPLRDYYRE